jgi:cell division protein FtsL
MAKKRNRKLKSGSSMTAVTTKWLLLAAAAVSFSLFYIWQHVQLVHTGFRIKDLEKELTEWKKANESITLINERLKSPQRIERVLAKKDLGLNYPKQKNIIRLRYPIRKNEQNKEASGKKGGTDTLLSYISGEGGAGQHKM